MLSRELTLAAAELQRAAPNAWARLVAAFEQHNTRRSHELTVSPPETVFVCQGRAQEIAALLESCKNCLRDAEKLARSGANG